MCSVELLNYKSTCDRSQEVTIGTRSRRRLSTVSSNDMVEILSPRRSKREKRLVFSNFKPSEINKQAYSTSTSHMFVTTDSDVSIAFMLYITFIIQTRSLRICQNSWFKYFSLLRISCLFRSKL